MEALLLDASAVARNAGIELRSKGSRLWACCPLHGEKTPSMCFFPDGRYHCFGCGADGDAADLYSALHGVPLAEALKVCKGTARPAQKPKGRTPEELRERLIAWKYEKWSAACRELHEAKASMDILEKQNTRQQMEQSATFWEALDRMATANDTLNLLDGATMAQLLKMCAEDK